MSKIRSAWIVQLLGAGAVFVGFHVVACGPDLPDEAPPEAAARYAEAICSEYARCGCVGEGYQDVSSCRQAAAALFHGAEQAPHVAFDGECFEAFVDHIPRMGCRGAYDDEPYEPFPCVPLRGTLARGAACEFDPYTAGLGYIVEDPCEGSDSCLDGRCGGPAREVSLGEPCGYALGVRCGYGQYCARSGTCDEHAELGQPCDTPVACVDGSATHCEGISPDSSGLGACVTRRVAGEACDPSSIGACVLSSSCDRSGTCGAAWPEVCHVLTPRDWYDPRAWVPAR